MGKVQIKLVRSFIGSTKRQKDTLKSLGFRKMQQVVEREATPVVMGMINKVKHMVQVKEA